MEIKNLDRLYEHVYDCRERLLKLCNAKGVHIGGALSSVEIIVALFHQIMHIDPKNPNWEERDRFILSKGHCSATMYLTMAQRGYFELDDVMETYKGHETRYGGHPCKESCPELDSSTGSLGHGLPIAEGIALSAKLNHKKYRAFCMIGDGESCEGSIWEAAMAAPHLKLGNLIVIVDRNMLSLDGQTEEIMPLEPFEDKWRAFNWNTLVVDGNNLEEVLKVLENLPPADSDVPTVIISKTVKGKGVSFMENVPEYHHKAISEEQLVAALAEINKAKMNGGKK
jgi:transketolase